MMLSMFVDPGAVIVDHCVDAALDSDSRAGLNLQTVALKLCSQLQCNAKLSSAVEAEAAWAQR